mmetsp:Transcript_24114/g.36470  ORF Transcript_24114/g.36470 Transcript_24114/m.36470 type:complete len:333 (+) Transcript_24114:64-1062(+)
MIKLLLFFVILALPFFSGAFLNSLSFHYCRSLEISSLLDPNVGVDRRRWITLVGTAPTLTWAFGVLSEETKHRVVFVAGAKGRSGLAVVEALEKLNQQQKDRIGVVAGVRDKNATILSQVDSVIGFDLQELNAEGKITEALEREKVTDIICTIGFKPTYISSVDRANADAIDYGATVTLIKAAAAMKNPPRFLLVSSLLTTAPEPRTTSYRLLNSLGGVLEQKAKAELFLTSSNMSYIILRPGVFVEQRQGNLIFAPKDSFIGDSIIDRGGLGPPVQCASPFFSSTGAVCGITRAQLGEAAVSLLFSESRLLKYNRTIEVVARPDMRQADLQ